MENSAEHSMETPKTVVWRQSLRQKLLSSFSGWRVPLLIFLLALTLKIWSMDPISNWDESWLGDIAAIMAERGNWLYPLYSGEGGLKLFDKPPLVFWIVGSFISVFGRSTIAVKLPLAIGSACSALAGYLFFSHFKKSRLIGVFVGILMAVAFFYNFYARTAYLDAFIYGLSALLGVVSIKAIDAHYKEDDYKKTVVYLILTLLMLTMNILAKAWQGFLVLPAVAFYLFIRHLGSIYEWESYSQILNEVKTRWLTHHLRMERTINSLVSGIVAFFIGVVIQVPIQLSFLVAMGLSLGTFAFGSVLKIDARSMSTKESSQKVSDDLDSNPQESEVDSESELDTSELNSLSLLGSPIFVKMVLVSLINGLILGGIFQLISKILYFRFERPMFEILPNAGIELQVLILTDPLMVSTILSAILGLPLVLLGFMLSGFFFLGMLSFLNVEPRCRHVILDLFKFLFIINFLAENILYIKDVRRLLSHGRNFGKIIVESQFFKHIGNGIQKTDSVFGKNFNDRIGVRDIIVDNDSRLNPGCILAHENGRAFLHNEAVSLFDSLNHIQKVAFDSLPFLIVRHHSPGSICHMKDIQHLPS